MPDLEPDDRHFELTELLIHEIRAYLGEGTGIEFNPLVLPRIERVLGELSIAHPDFQPVHSRSTRAGLEEPHRRAPIANHARRLARQYQQTGGVKLLEQIQRSVYDLLDTHSGVSRAWLEAESDLLNVREGRLLLSQIDG